MIHATSKHEHQYPLHPVYLEKCRSMNWTREMGETFHFQSVIMRVLYIKMQTPPLNSNILICLSPLAEVIYTWLNVNQNAVTINKLSLQELQRDISWCFFNYFLKKLYEYTNPQVAEPWIMRFQCITNSFTSINFSTQYLYILIRSLILSHSQCKFSFFPSPASYISSFGSQNFFQHQSKK